MSLFQAGRHWRAPRHWSALDWLPFGFLGAWLPGGCG